MGTKTSGHPHQTWSSLEVKRTYRSFHRPTLLNYSNVETINDVQIDLLVVQQCTNYSALRRTFIYRGTRGQWTSILERFRYGYLHWPLQPNGMGWTLIDWSDWTGCGAHCTSFRWLFKSIGLQRRTNTDWKIRTLGKPLRGPAKKP